MSFPLYIFLEVGVLDDMSSSVLDVLRRWWALSGRAGASSNSELLLVLNIFFQLGIHSYPSLVLACPVGE
jgi:hypothetical protein